MSQLSLCKLSKLSLCIVITFFQQVLDNDRLKTLLQHFVHHFCTIAVIMFMTAQGYVWAFREHKFKHNFQDCLNPLCLCGNEIETSTHYLLHCPTYTNERLTLLNKIKSINCSILESSDAAVTKILLFGDNTLSNSSNTFILNSTIEYIISTQRFKGSILTPV